MASDATPFDSQVVDWFNQVAEGNNPLSFVGENKIKEIYALAFTLYNHQQYQEASHFFRLLILCQPSAAKFWKGLGACLQMERDYEQALDCYMSSQLLNGNNADPYIYVHAADCHFALKQKEEGLKALEAAKKKGKEVNDIGILKHVALMKDLWSSPK